MSTRILTMNEQVDLSIATAIVDLQHVLIRAKPHAGGLEEWAVDRDKATTHCLAKLGYAFTRGVHGGEPVLWDIKRYDFHKVRSVRLSRREFVGHLPGRRDRLGASWATEVILDDLQTFSQTVVLAAHLTAEVEDAKHGGYKRDPRHLLRVMRHKREKRRLGRRARWHKKRGRRVFVLGDTNYSRMPLGGFIGCWDNRSGGSLGWRAVDIVYSDRPAIEVRTFKTASDHDAVVALYP